MIKYYPSSFPRSKIVKFHRPLNQGVFTLIYTAPARLMVALVIIYFFCVVRIVRAPQPRRKRQCHVLCHVHVRYLVSSN